MTDPTDAGPELLVERRGPVLVLQFNRPRARNAMSLALAEQIAAALEELDSDPTLAFTSML